MIVEIVPDAVTDPDDINCTHQVCPPEKVRFPIFSILDQTFALPLLGHGC